MNILQRVILVGGMLAVAINALYAPRIYTNTPSQSADRALIFSDSFRRADVVPHSRDVGDDVAANLFLTPGLTVVETWQPVELHQNLLLASTVAGAAVTLALFCVAGLGNRPRVPGADA